MNLVSLKLDPDKDFRWMFYSDLGLDLYSNGIMVSPKLVKGASRRRSRACCAPSTGPCGKRFKIPMRRSSFWRPRSR